MRGGSRILMIFGVFIIVLAGVGLYLYKVASTTSSSSNAPLTEPTRLPEAAVVVAAIDIDAGTLISDTATLLEMKNIPGEDFAADPDAYYKNVNDLRNLKALNKLRGNDAIRKSDVGPAGLASKIPAAAAGQPQVRAFPIQVNNLTGVAGLVEPGDFVDVMASFSLDVTTFRPGVPQAAATGETNQAVVEQLSNEGSVKVLLQDIQVIEIVKPADPQPTPEGQQAPPPEPEPTPAQQQVPVNDSGVALQTGNWIMVIGVTDQQAEALRFALDRGIGISTLLRRAGDHTKEHTVGSTLRILIDHFGMPVPSSIPPAQQAGPVQVPNVPSLPLEDPEVWAPAAPAETAK